MNTRNKHWKLFECLSHLKKNFSRHAGCTGQALVEFTLCFILLLVIAWIPADFGMMFYTGHIGQNAAREGARIAAADPTISTQVGTCNLPCSSGSDLLQRIAHRAAAGLMANAGTTITVGSTGAAATCDQEVQVEVRQTYYPFFYKILRMMYFTVPDSVPLNRTVTMRYEHQC
jgi:Flp pilus assembly protein TadG